MPEDTTQAEGLEQRLAAVTREVITEETGKVTERLDQMDGRLTALETPPEAPEADEERAKLYGRDGEGEVQVRGMRTPDVSRLQDEYGRVRESVLNADPQLVNDLGDSIRTMIAAKFHDMNPRDAIAEYTIGRYGNKRAADFLRTQMGLTRALTVGTAGDGGDLVKTMYGNLIELLYANSVVTQAGAQVIPIKANLTLPQITAGATAANTAETGAITASQPTFGTVTFSPEDITALVPVSNDLIEDAGYDVNAYVVQDVVMQLKLKLDFDVLYGTGSNTIAGVDGQITPLTPTTGSGSTVADLKSITGAYFTANPRDAKRAWITHPQLLTFLSYVVSSTGAIIFQNELEQGRFRGAPIYTSTQVPYVSSTQKTDLWLADWNELVIGQAQGTRIDTSREASFVDGSSNTISAFQNRMTLIRASLRADAQMRHTGVFQQLASVDLSGSGWSWT